jgi:hypothetical protein
MHSKRFNNSLRIRTRHCVILLAIVTLIAAVGLVIRVACRRGDQARSDTLVYAVGFGGGYEVDAWGSRRSEVQRELRDVLSHIVSSENSRTAPVGLRIHATNVSQEALFPLARCDNGIGALSLHDVQLTPAVLRFIGQLRTLKFLDLAHTGLHDLDLIELRQLAELRQLDVRGNNVTAAGVAALREALPKCNIRAPGPGVLDNRHN